MLGPMRCLCIGIVVLLLILEGESTKTYEERCLLAFGKNESMIPTNQKPVCIVAAYDKLRGFLNWPQDWFKKSAAINCKTRVIFEEKKDITKAHVVIFHAPTHGSEGNRLPPVRNKNALYAMVSMEQPKYAPHLSDTKYLQSQFNLTLTYSLSPHYPGTTVPNLPITYYPLNIVSTEAVMQPARPFADKTGYNTGVSVVLFTSNCDRAGATERFKYVEELMKHIKVHSYGRCFNNRKEPEMPDDKAWPAVAQKRARKVKILSQYKFYLAFENAPVDDYVSEKVFEGLIAGSVSVYRGASSIHKFMPSNDSFIDANKLKPAELAKKLKALAENESEYNKFFAFKNAPLSAAFEDMALKSYVHPNVLCRVCDYYMEHKPTK